MKGIFFLALILLSTVKSEVDPNFYIFLCFGQSNMEGKGPIEDQDRKNIPENFQTMAAIDMPITKRKGGQWYLGEPPLCRDGTKISPADYFGRHLAESLPDNYKVGVINVAIAAVKIEMFMEDKVEEYLKKNASDSIREKAKKYNNNTFRVLVDRGKEAQKVGVIKGILLHQGEGNKGEEDWVDKVNLVYTRLLNELNLKQEEVPLLAGEVVRSEYNGTCSKHNKIIAKLPSVIKNAHVISAEGLPPQDDRTHFTTASYRTFGKRYAEKMLEILKGEKTYLKDDHKQKMKFLGFYEDEDDLVEIY